MPTAAPAFTYDVFISHATKDDAALIDRIAQALTDAGLRVYVDHHRLQPGDEWDRAIQLALQQSRVGLLALSPHSLASPECLGEWRYVLNQQRRLYVARIAPVALADFHSRLCIIQYADLVDDFALGMAALVQALRSAHGHLDAASPAVRVTQTSGGSFPHDQLDLPIFGRDDLLAALPIELLRQHPVVLTGIGGVGKTKLAAVLAATGAYIDGVVWYRLPPAADAAQAQLGLDNLTALLREHLQLPPSTPEAQTWDALGQQQCLLVLDNAEDCLRPQPYAARLLALRQAQAAVLLTSRHLWPELKNRAHERRLDVPAAEAAEAILTAMVARGGEVASPAPAETRALAAAARYHPRLLEFTSGWLKSYEPAWVLRRLQELRGRDIEAALHEVVGQTIALVAQTPDGPQALHDLSQLVVYSGGFDIAAAEALLPTTFEASIPLLRAWYLLRFERPRYSVDPLVAAAVEVDEAAYVTHYEYYVSLARQHNKRQDYVGLAQELVNLEAAFEWALRVGEVEKAYWLANAAKEVLHNQGRFAQRLQWLQQVSEALPSNMNNEIQSALFNSFGISYTAQPLGDRKANLRMAIEAFQTALSHCAEQTAPLSFAASQNNIGNAYRNLAQVEEREANLRRAIVAYQAALRHYTEQATPLDFATTQNNIGNAYRNLAQVEEREANLRRSIQAFQAALCHRTEQVAPLDFAATQNNLGNTYRDLAQVEEREANLRHAVEAFQVALRYYTKQAAPLSFAATQNNLGNVYGDLAELEEREANLHRAIEAFQTALRYYTEQATPLDFAVTQNNLGAAYQELAEVQERTTNLHRAIDAYEISRRAASRFGASRQYAQSSANLGIVQEILGDLPEAIRCWQQAEAAYQLFNDLPAVEQMQQWITIAEETLRQSPPAP